MHPPRDDRTLERVAFLGVTGAALVLALVLQPEPVRDPPPGSAAEAVEAAPPRPAPEAAPPRKVAPTRTARRPRPRRPSRRKAAPAPSTQAAPGFTPNARVMVVMDGDSLKVRLGKKSQEVRVAEIDCPELSQPFGHDARRFSRQLIERQVVQVEGIEKDRYGRMVGHVKLADGRSLGEELVRAGYAWRFDRFAKSRLLETLEREARGEKRGLWASADPVAPWIWRRRRRGG